MNIIEHLSRTVTPAVLGNQAGDANRASLLEKVYAIIVARLADNNIYNSFANTTVNGDDHSFFDRFLPDNAQRGQIARELGKQYNVPEQEAQSLVSRAAPLAYNEIRNLAGSNNVAGFLGDNIKSVGAALPTWSYAIIPASALGLMNIKHAGTETVVKETTRVQEQLVASPKPEEGGLGKILLPLIGLLILGLLAWWLLRSCNKQPEPVATPVVASAAASTVTISSAPVDTMASPASATIVASTVVLDAQGASVAGLTDANTVTATASGASATGTADTVAMPADDVIPEKISETEPSVYLHHGQLKFYFAVDKDDLSPKAQEKVSSLVAAAKQGKKLGISGYTDSTGNAAHNEDLAKRRAEAVKKFLMDNGIPESQLVMNKPDNTVGAQGNTQEGRRVEVYVVDGPEVVKQ